MKLYTVTLEPCEREELSRITRQGSDSSQKVINALILLNCDEGPCNGQRNTGEIISEVRCLSQRKVDRAVELDYVDSMSHETVRRVLKKRNQALPARPGQVAREDHECRRLGVCNVFMATEPLAGRRSAEVTERRTKSDWARFLKRIAEQYPQARKITLVMDNLNTHRHGALPVAWALLYVISLFQAVD